MEIQYENDVKISIPAILMSMINDIKIFFIFKKDMIQIYIISFILTILTNFEK